MYSSRKKIQDEAEAQALLEQFETYRGTFRSFCAETHFPGSVIEDERFWFVAFVVRISEWSSWNLSDDS